MTPDFIAVHEDWTVQQVLDFVREHGHDSETLNVIYVVDERGKLIDDIRIREFLLRPLTAKVSDIRDRHVRRTQRERLAGRGAQPFRKYDRDRLAGGRFQVDVLVGIVTIDDMLDVAEAEATEDIQKLGGMEALDEPYTTHSAAANGKQARRWLVILFLGEMLTATAMEDYNSEIEKAVILAMFLPLIISSGGNSGSQATTLIIRAMALGEVASARLVSCRPQGIAVGTFTRLNSWNHRVFSEISLWQYLHIFDYGKYHWLVALTVGAALVGVVLWGTLVARCFLLLRRCGLDPAASSAPFVATLVDVTGLVIYFNVALFILRGTLL